MAACAIMRRAIEKCLKRGKKGMEAIGERGLAKAGVSVAWLG